jgi:hypothetical protein
MRAAQAVAWRHGFRWRGTLPAGDAQPVATSDLILVMEPEHLRFIATMAPENRGKSLLFGQWLETRTFPTRITKAVKPLNMFSSNWESQSGMGSSFELTRNEAVMSSSKSDKYSAATPQNNEMDLIQLLAEMFDHRVMIACVTLLFTVCAGIYAFSARRFIRLMPWCRSKRSRITRCSRT